MMITKVSSKEYRHKKQVVIPMGKEELPAFFISGNFSFFISLTVDRVFTDAEVLVVPTFFT